jgi:hypothetical protein
MVLATLKSRSPGIPSKAYQNTALSTPARCDIHFLDVASDKHPDGFSALRDVATICSALDGSNVIDEIAQCEEHINDENMRSVTGLGIPLINVDHDETGHGDPCSGQK